MKASERAVRELNAYYDGELGWWRKRRFEARLAGSSSLQTELAALERMGEALREAEAEALAPDLWAGVRARLLARDEGAERVPGLGWRPRAVWAGLAVAAAAGVLTLLVTRGGEVAPPEPRLARREAPAPVPEAPLALAAPGERAAPGPVPAPLEPRPQPSPASPTPPTPVTEVARAPAAARPEVEPALVPELPELGPTPARGAAMAPVALASGVVRSIDTGGRPFLVSEEHGTTIIWLIDGPEPALPVGGARDL